MRTFPSYYRGQMGVSHVAPVLPEIHGLDDATVLDVECTISFLHESDETRFDELPPLLRVLIEPDGPGSMQHESLWAYQLVGDRVRLLNVPYTHGYAWGDVVRIKCQDDLGRLPLVLHVVEESVVPTPRDSA